MPRLNIVVLGSTRGTSIQSVIDAIDDNTLHANISLIISNRSKSLILQRATDNDIACKFVGGKGLSTSEYDNLLINEIDKHNPDIVLLAGFMRILGCDFVTHFAGKILNIHPSLLPKHAGLMDLDVHKAVIDAGDVISGCTIHQVTEDVDAGEIVEQFECAVVQSDTPETLKEKVQVLENKAWVKVVKNWVDK
tara:strand:+ start:513 stop:1091 length:579 start_codon:yes stop_codon:yes gene_type:complete